MSKKIMMWVLTAVIMGSIACNLMTPQMSRQATQPVAGQITQPPPMPQAGGALSARALSSVSVQLDWNPVGGATGYTIEVRYGNGDFTPVAQLPGDQTSYTHYVLPGSSAVSYQVTAATPAGAQAAGTSTVQLPDLAPHPLIVQYQTYPPAPIDISKIDPKNPPDLASLMKIPSTSQVIGAGGGAIPMAGPDQAQVTLTVPPGAVAEDTTFTLTPIKTVTGLPLSGGLLGAVIVGPQQTFNPPLTLTIQSSATPAGMLPVGFSISDTLSELSLMPFISAASHSLTPLAGPIPVSLALQAQTGGSSSGLSVSQGGAYGVASGTLQEILAQAANIPSDAGSQLAQQVTVQQSADTGLNPESHAVEFSQIGQNILDRAGKADAWRSLLDTLASANEYWLEGGSEVNNALNAKLIDAFLAKMKTLLDKNKGNCLTLEDENAAELVSKLQTPPTNFWKFLAGAFNTKYGNNGQQLLNDLAMGKKSCTFTLEINSTITIKNAAGQADIKVHTPKPIQLTLNYIDQRLVLVGQGTLNYDQYVITGQSCTAKIVQYPQITFNIQELYPIFTNNQVSDFWLVHSSPDADWSAIVKATGKVGGKCPPPEITLSGGGDSWSGAYILLRNSSDGEVNQWKAQNGFTWDNTALVATRKFANYTINVAGGTITENTTFTLTVKRAGK